MSQAMPIHKWLPRPSVPHCILRHHWDQQKQAKMKRQGSVEHGRKGDALPSGSSATG